MDGMTHAAYWCVILALAVAVLMIGHKYDTAKKELSEEKKKSRRDKRDMYHVRMDEVEDSAKREEACRVEAASLARELKAAHIVNEGLWNTIAR